MNQPNVKYMPFKQMKATLALLQTAVLMVVVTLNIETLTPEQKLTAATIMVGRDKTATRLKSNPTRKQMLALCGAWYRWANQVQPLIPEDQPVVRESFTAALKEAEWVAALDQDKPMAEVKS